MLTIVSVASDEKEKRDLNGSVFGYVAGHDLFFDEMANQIVLRGRRAVVNQSGDVFQQGCVRVGCFGSKSQTRYCEWRRLE